MKTWVALLLTACSNDPAPIAKPPVAPVITPIAVADAAAPDAPRDLRAELNFPARKIDAKEIIWRTEPDVTNAIGKGSKRDDGRYRHELGDGDSFLVVYDKGRAVGVELMTTRPGFTGFDREKKMFVAERLGVAVETKDGRELWSPIRGRAIRLGDTFGGVGIGVYDEAYIVALTERVEREANAAVEAERRRVEQETARLMRTVPQRDAYAEALSKVLVQGGMTIIVNAVGPAHTTLEVAAFGGTCDEPTLRKVATGDVSISLRKAGFKRMSCAHPDDAGAFVDL